MARPVIPWTTDPELYEDVMDDNPQFLGFVSEGDSWFAFPAWLRTNVISELARINNQRAYWLRLETIGHEILDILDPNQRQYRLLVELFSDDDYQIDGIFFSGGGNDIVDDNLPPFLNRYQEGMTAAECINETTFGPRMDEIEEKYEALIALRDKYRPKVVLFTHAYDFAYASNRGIRLLFGLVKNGPWIAPAMRDARITDKPGLPEEVLHLMLRRFHTMQERLESRHKRLVYVRTQGTLANEWSWGDELHPLSEGFKILAAKFQVAMRSVFPQLPKSQLALWH